MDIDMELDDPALSSDNDYEEEEFLVYVDIEPTSLGENQIGQAENVKLFGLETKKPLLQINNLFFEGESDVSLGTHVFFEKDVTVPVDELYCKCENYFKFRAKTNKILKMSRVLVKDNATDSKIIQEKDMKEIKEQLKITRTYEEALSLFLVPGRNPPNTFVTSPNNEDCEDEMVFEPSSSQSLQGLKQERVEKSAVRETKEQKNGSRKTL